MNLAAYLMRQVTSLEDRELPKRHYDQAPKTPVANRNRHEETVRRYCEVMKGKGWMTTIEVTEAVSDWNVEHGFRRIQDSFPTLSKWFKNPEYGYVERRTRDEAKTWGRRAREEWRWIK